MSSTLNAQHTYGVHAHLFPSGVLCTDAHMHSSNIVTSLYFFIKHTNTNILSENPGMFSKDMNICHKLYHLPAHSNYCKGNGANQKLKSLPLVDEL